MHMSLGGFIVAGPTETPDNPLGDEPNEARSQTT